MIDIHTHILPGLDDGAKDIEDSIGLLKEAEKEGIKIVFATPHYIPGLYRPSIKEITQAMSNLRKRISEEGIKIELIVGAEVNIEAEFDCERMLSYSLNGAQKHILLELPFVSYPLNVEKRIEHFQSCGLVPVIAHPERAFLIIKNPEKVKEWKKRGMLFQVNSKSILGRYGKMERKTAIWMLKNGLVDFIGSDTHNSKWGFDFDEVRPVLEKIVGKPKTDELLGQNARRILLPDSTL